MTVKVRFAPSPTGKLHVGNIRTALLNWLFAKANNGRFLLRIDDTDLQRSTAAFETGIFADMDWLGLVHDETMKQSARFASYDQAAGLLKSKDLLYPCFETADELDRQRKLQRAQGKPPVYNRAALALSDTQRTKLEAEGRTAHWRFKLSSQPVIWDDVIRGEQRIDTASLSDPVLIRADGSYLYTLPSVVDDIDLEISHIVRGEDHVTNSAAQIEIFRALGADAPKMGHHPLLVGADGGKLSKRLGTLSVAGLRDEEQMNPMAILSLLAKIGTSDPVEVRQELSQLVTEFSFSKIARAPARFDPAELNALNAKLLHEASYADVQEKLTNIGADGGEALWMAIRGNLNSLQDAKTWLQIVSAEITPIIASEDTEFLQQAAALIPDEIDANSWSELTSALKNQTGRKGKTLFMPLRLALTGQQHGPDMGAILPLLGAARARTRLG
ncbi:Glutamyl-tRNA(Gln) synthetase [hydrothermal vent metagenome]|uniref:Glutamyl-tRNA(Gln) synthetase n=1 Tax=hydrothermal vent metagenome TaxID=652676 RepID=A0A3B0R220_9ZZZZ